MSQETRNPQALSRAVHYHVVLGVRSPRVPFTRISSSLRVLPSSKYCLPGSSILQLPKRTDWGTAPDFMPGTKVRAHHGCNGEQWATFTRPPLLVECYGGP